MHLNAKSALRLMTRRARRVAGKAPLHVRLNRRYLREAIEAGKEFLAGVPVLDEVVLHYPLLNPTKGFSRERITVTRNTKVPA